MKGLKNHPQKVGAKGLVCVSKIEIDLRSVWYECVSYFCVLLVSR